MVKWKSGLFGKGINMIISRESRNYYELAKLIVKRFIALAVVVTTLCTWTWFVFIGPHLAAWQDQEVITTFRVLTGILWGIGAVILMLWSCNHIAEWFDKK